MAHQNRALLAEPFIAVLFQQLRTVEPRHRKLKARNNPYGPTFMYLVSEMTLQSQPIRSTAAAGADRAFPKHQRNARFVWVRSFWLFAYSVQTRCCRPLPALVLHVGR